MPWSVADRLAGPLTLADCSVLMLAFSDNAATNVLLDRLGLEAVNAEAGRLGAERTAVRRQMMAQGPENVTCAADLARGIAAIDDPRVLEPLVVAHDSELPLRLHGREVLVKTGEIWPRVYHEVALVDRRLGSRGVLGARRAAGRGGRRGRRGRRAPPSIGEKPPKAAV